MSLYENMLFSKVLDEKNFFVLNRKGLKEEYLTEKGLALYTFIKSYISNNEGFPDYRTVSEMFPDFSYELDVTDSYDYLIDMIINNYIKKKVYSLLNDKVSDKYNKSNGTEFVEWLDTEIESLKSLYTRKATGSNWGTNGEERKEQYLNAKNKKTIVVPTPFDTLNKFLEGGIEGGDYVLIQAYTNIGKSWLASMFGVTAWEKGFDVIHYSPEINTSKQLSRLDTLKKGFMNSKLNKGTLYNEKDYFDYLDNFKADNVKTNYIVKSMEDIDSLTVALIESDLALYPKTKMVIIDGFLLMNHSQGHNLREKLSNTSRMLRQLFNKYGIIGIVVHQIPTSAKKENDIIDIEGARIPNPAQIHQYSETIAVIQDATLVLNYDACNGLGKILIAKAKLPCVDESIELTVDYNIGKIQETTSTEEYKFNF